MIPTQIATLLLKVKPLISWFEHSSLRSEAAPAPNVLLKGRASISKSIKLKKLPPRIMDPKFLNDDVTRNLMFLG